MRFLSAALALAVGLTPALADARRRRAPKAEREPRVRLYHEGDDVPEGYHVETRSRTGLAAVGAGLFGGVYTLTALAAAASHDSDRDWLFVPVMGPLIFAANEPKGDGLGTAVLALNSVAQAAGLTLLVIGVNTKMTILARSEVSMQVTPSCSNTGCALTALGRF